MRRELPITLAMTLVTGGVVHLIVRQIVRDVRLAEILALAMSVAVGVLMSIFYWRAGIRRNRLAGGLCARCGYDLCASRDRCPECGAAALSGVTGPKRTDP